MHDKTFYRIDGRLYTFLGGYGAQLFSIELNDIPLGTPRVIANRMFGVFSTERLSRWSTRHRISWSLVIDDSVDLDAHRKAIDSLQKYLKKL